MHGLVRAIRMFATNMALLNFFAYDSGVTDRLMRMEEAESDSPASVPAAPLKPCQDCKITFYCSDSHRDAIRHAHAETPAPDGHDGLSQCQIQQEIRQDLDLANLLAGAPTASGGFQWAPNRVKQAWLSLKGSNWQDELGADISSELGIPHGPALGPFIRAASDGLSMPMTILHALESLQKSDQWTRQGTLNIHVRL